MGVLPLEYLPDQTAESLGLTGKETFSFVGIRDLAPRKTIAVRAKDDAGKETIFQTVARADTPEEVAYFQHGGILRYVLRQMLSQETPP